MWPPTVRSHIRSLSSSSSSSSWSSSSSSAGGEGGGERWSDLSELLRVCVWMVDKDEKVAHEQAKGWRRWRKGPGERLPLPGCLRNPHQGVGDGVIYLIVSTGAFCVNVEFPAFACLQRRGRQEQWGLCWSGPPPKSCDPRRFARSASASPSRFHRARICCPV